MFLKNTVEDILAHMECDTDIIVGLDGAWANPSLIDHPLVTVIHHSVPIGQRAITNECAKLSKAKYLMKVDAHCAFDQGFDLKMMEKMEDDMTMVPVMRNLHAFDWVCSEGHRRYQGPSGPCIECGKETVRDVVWIAKNNPQSYAYRFDKEMHFQYWNEWGKEQAGDLTESLSIQGSCFMCTREKYFELDLCSEELNSWGQQGVEVACKTWLSGGRVMINHKTWYAHMFRTQGGDFSFPYHNPQSKVMENRQKTRELFAEDKWPLATHKFQWLINKFQPPEWEVKLKKAIVYYTTNQISLKIAKKVQDQLRICSNLKDIPIYSSSLKPMPHFGIKNTIQPLEHYDYQLVDGVLKEVFVPRTQPGYLTMFKQILDGLKMADADIIFFCEHDVLYHPSHFDFIPPKKDVYYYNTNVWHYRLEDGHCLYFNHRSTSGLCAYRETLIKHYEERVRRVEKDGYDHNTGYEPGTHHRESRIDDLTCEDYQSEFPNVDIRHTNNLTKNRWSKDEFHTKPIEWIEAEEIPGWGKIRF